MKKTGYSILLFLAIAGAFLVGSWYGQRRGGKPGIPEVRRLLHQVDLRHAAQESGTPVLAESGRPSGPAHVHGRPSAEFRANPTQPWRDSAAATPGAVAIGFEKQQLSGVRVSRVEKAAAAHTLRLLGRVVPDESRVFRINAGIEGFVREVSAVTTGNHVTKDQVLAAFSAPSAIQAIQGYLLAHGALNRARQSAAEGTVEAQSAPLANANIQQRVEQLQNLGMSALQLEEIRRTREIPKSIKIVAPADGLVLARNISPDQKFERGAEFYRIADLRRVWILADVFETEAQYLQPGKSVAVFLPQQGRTLQAKVSTVSPLFDPAARTLKVRLEAENPDDILRPEMFVDLELPITRPPTLTVPADAVVDSGVKKTVYVGKGEGIFEPRRVETGWRHGGRVEIMKGLIAGERIVVSGTFLIDSESRMKAAAGVPGKDGVARACGTEVDPSCAGHRHETSTAHAVGHMHH